MLANEEDVRDSLRRVFRLEELYSKSEDLKIYTDECDRNSTIDEEIDLFERVSLEK